MGQGPHHCYLSLYLHHLLAVRCNSPEADTPPQKRLLLTTPRPGCEIGESSAAEDHLPVCEARLRALESLEFTVLDTEVFASPTKWQRQAAVNGVHISLAVPRPWRLEHKQACDTLRGQSVKMTPKRATRSTRATTTTPAPTATTTTTVTNAQLQAMIDQGVSAALAARDATRNGTDSHSLGTGVRGSERVARGCTYQDFYEFKPLYLSRQT
ncbi:hypothetical protein Tco_0040398 [Tanacetum coccineum]